jgi:threonine aldolase
MSEGFVDLRSDTVTRPTAAMRRAMADADVGDDVYAEDPTINALQEAFAARVGKEAALFVPSGTMGNQLALRLLTRPGTSVVAGRRQHIVIYENAAAAWNAGVQFTVVDDDDGMLAADDVSWIRRASGHHHPAVALVCVENTHMPSGGTPWPLERLDALAALGVPLHLDGARLFNAEVATGVAASAYSRAATTVMCCMSKGLGAPVGSLLAGPSDVMAEARAMRQRLGGGMRQAGVIAAAALVALTTMVERLAEDHLRARRLAETVAECWPGAGLDPERVSTNMVIWSLPNAEEVLAALRADGVLAGTIAPDVLRMVTHLDVDDDDIARASKALAAVARA